MQPSLRLGIPPCTHGNVFPFVEVWSTTPPRHVPKGDKCYDCGRLVTMELSMYGHRWVDVFGRLD